MGICFSNYAEKKITQPKILKINKDGYLYYPNNNKNKIADLNPVRKKWKPKSKYEKKFKLNKNYDKNYDKNNFNEIQDFSLPGYVESCENNI